MKNYKKILACLPVLVIGWVTLACEKVDINRVFEGPYFVRFTDTTLTYKESYNQQIAIQVHNAGPQLSEPITVNYTVSGSAREGRDYSIVGTKGTVVIPANKSTGEIYLKLINNANNILESQSLTFTLTGVQPNSLQVGFGEGGIVGKTLKFIIRDDCLFGGTYTGVLTLGGQSASLANIDITSDDCKTYTVANWNIGLSSFFGFDAVKPTLRFIDNGDNSLTIPKQANVELTAPRDTISGTGSWNPQNRQITLNVRLKVGTQSGKDTTYVLPFTYTPQ